MADYLNKYGVARTIERPLVKRGVADYAVGADWTPVAGDVKISKDGGAAANVTNLPTALTMGNTAVWVFVLTATEMQAARIIVTISDAATKAVEDDSFDLETYGHASAQHEFDLDTATVVASSISTGGIVAASFAAGAIDAAAIATDAIGSAELAASAVTEIQSGLATSAEVAGVQSDTNDIQTRLPAALVGGRMDSSVGAMAADVVTAASIATDAIGSAELAASAVTEIQSGLATSAEIAAVQSDTNDIQTRLPAALVAGRMDSSVGAVAAGAITAAAIATDAIDSDAIAASAVTELQSGLATSAALATVQADTDDIQTRLPATLVGGRIDASVGTMAAGVVTAAAVATDAIDADALAASAVTEIQSGLATAASIATVQADTDDIQTRLPAALVGGRMDSSVGAMAAGTITSTVIATGAVDADALATDAVNEIADGVLDRAITEPAGVFSWATASLRTIIGWLGAKNRNKTTQTSTTTTLRNDADSATLATSTVSDVAGTFTRGEWT